MKPENIAVLEQHIQHWHRLKFIGDFSMPMHVRKEINAVYEDELKPRSKQMLWCGSCAADMTRIIYLHYERTAPKPILENTLLVTISYPNGKNKTRKSKDKSSESKSN